MWIWSSKFFFVYIFRDVCGFPSPSKTFKMAASPENIKGEIIMFAEVRYNFLVVFLFNRTLKLIFSTL